MSLGNNTFIEMYTEIIHQVARLNAIVIKIIIHEWVISMQTENTKLADIHFNCQSLDHTRRLDNASYRL